jgi:hypothetical protein
VEIKVQWVNDIVEFLSCNEPFTSLATGRCLSCPSFEWKRGYEFGQLIKEK